MNIFQKVTLKNLKENHTRTLVTIVGIILSAAMFTAVTTSVSSLLSYLIEYTKYTEGEWYGAFYQLSREDADSFSSDDQVESYTSLELLGFSALEKSSNEFKPYLCVYGVSDNASDLLPIHLISGRMPQNEHELLLPEHLNSSQNLSWKIGDTLNLALGARDNGEGEPLDNHTPIYSDDAGNPITETLCDTKNHTYTVTGFYKRPSFEDYSAPGYAALTVSTQSADNWYDVYLRTFSGENISSYVEDYSKGASQLNYDLLRLYGYSGESSYNAVLNRLALILICLIMFGSISLIYNAFSISISERTRQFGLMSSIGATRKQLTKSVLFEAFFLSCIGIPLGIFFGLLGIGVTFHFTGDMISNFLYSGSSITLRLHPSAPALLAAVAVSLVTILISAYIPARRAMKKSAIDAIRQSSDISIRPGKIKTAHLTEKLFGFEGMLAAKYYKRNRRKYRATVISLFLSVVLFISASSFCAYLNVSAGGVLTDIGFDISCSLSPEANYDLPETMKLLSEVKGVTSTSYTASFYPSGTLLSSSLSKEYEDYEKLLAQQMEMNYAPGKTADTSFLLHFIEDQTFRDYLSQNNLTEKDYFQQESPRAVLVDTLSFYNSETSKYYRFCGLDHKADPQITLYIPKIPEGFYYDNTTLDAAGNSIYFYQSEEENDKPLELSQAEACDALTVQIGAVLDELPALTSGTYSTFVLIYPYSMMDTIFSTLDSSTEYEGISGFPVSQHNDIEMTFKCQDHTQAAADMNKLSLQKGLGLLPDDYAAMAERDRAMSMVINIFSFGFIILISLIAAANVFNTISTNINLRRREFAMLKSVGLTPGGFRKMMCFECLLYGFRGLLYGIPVSIGITWLIYRSVSNGLEMAFFVPWYSIAIAVGSVFAVVFATMLYSVRKIKHENTIDELKNENL